MTPEMHHARQPLCGEQEFIELINEMVADQAPRLFAVVQEHGERVDARVAAWGLAFEDRAEVVGASGGVRMLLAGPESAVRMYGRRPGLSARLVWVPAGSAPPAADLVTPAG